MGGKRNHSLNEGSWTDMFGQLCGSFSDMPKALVHSLLKFNQVLLPPCLMTCFQVPLGLAFSEIYVYSKNYSNTSIFPGARTYRGVISDTITPEIPVVVYKVFEGFLVGSCIRNLVSGVLSGPAISHFRLCSHDIYHDVL